MASNFQAFIQQHPEILLIELLWLDISSTLRCRVLTARHFQELLKQKAYHGVPSNHLWLLDNTSPDFDDETDSICTNSLLIPDFSNITVCPWNIRHACMFCFFGTGYDDLLPSNIMQPRTSVFCPRQTLFKAVEDIKMCGIEILVGIEIEFVVFAVHSERFQQFSQTFHRGSASQTSMKLMGVVLEEIVLSLENVGVSIQHYQTETLQDQFEIALEPKPPLVAADSYLVAKENIRAICAKHSLNVTFHPWMPVTSGVHVNISVKPVDNKIENYFLAGLLHHTRALCAFGLPLPVSYKRVNVNHYHQATGSHVSWGVQNRQTPFRQRRPGLWELRFADGFTQIFLFLASVIQSGLHGISDRIPLTIKNCSVDPASLANEALEELGITEKLPSTMEIAQEALIGDKWLNDKLGKDYIIRYVVLMKTLALKAQAVGNFDSNEQRIWLSKRY